MRVRRYRKSDIAQIAVLYYDTVHTVNSRDYSPQQINAWAPRIYPTRYWANRWRKYTVFVAEAENQVVGFTEFAKSGKINCFYVHNAWQGKGVGTQLLKAIEQQARQWRIKRLFADVSLTAAPFFKHHGFSIQRKQMKFYHNQRFTQFVMVKRMLI